MSVTRNFPFSRERYNRSNEPSVSAYFNTLDRSLPPVRLPAVKPRKIDITLQSQPRAFAPFIFFPLEGEKKIRPARETLSEGKKFSSFGAPVG